MVHSLYYLFLIIMNLPQNNFIFILYDENYEIVFNLMLMKNYYVILKKILKIMM